MGVGYYDLSVTTKDGHRVWLDVFVAAGKDARQVTMHNGYQADVNRHVFNTRECRIPQYGTTLDWWLECKHDGGNWEQYWRS
jgi:hypothetical protein